MQQQIDNLTHRYHQVQQEIAKATARFQRPAESVALLAVSKTRSVEEVAILANLGQTAFGENYLQDALTKIEALRDRHLEWHFIGAIQSNKTRVIAENFSWVHTLDRKKIAERLSEQRPTYLPPLQICIQVNISGELSKSGVGLDELGELIAAVAQLPQLKLRGLMVIPRATVHAEEQRESFSQLRLAQEALTQSGYTLDQLSMGMSGDLESAIAEGSTMVRIGTALFGPRA